MLNRPLRIGTRGSPMALAQTGMVRDRIVAANPGLETELVVVTTVADKILDRPLSEIGGKGLFTKELEQALFAGEVDVAVHSMKDVETWLPDGLTIACILERDDPRDAFLSPHADGLAGLAPGARVGTSSLRRGAQVLMRRSDLRVVPLRGNANTPVSATRRSSPWRACSASAWKAWRAASSRSRRCCRPWRRVPWGSSVARTTR
jgi:hydroxymethylbilane synthase